MEMVTEGGLASLSMNKLADGCDYTPGALYRYFDSKDALYGALVERVLNEIHETLASALEDVPNEAPFARLFTLVKAYRRFSVEHPNKFGLLAMSMAQPQVLLNTKESTEPVVSSIQRVLGLIAGPLAQAEMLGLLPSGEIHERTLIFFSAVQGVVQLRKQARIAPALLDIDRLSAATVRTLLLGWGADPVAVTTAYEEARSGGPS
jgi:AcrR family transcriptional regulator